MLGRAKFLIEGGTALSMRFFIREVLLCGSGMTVNEVHTLTECRYYNDIRSLANMGIMYKGVSGF